MSHCFFFHVWIERFSLRVDKFDKCPLPLGRHLHVWQGVIKAIIIHQKHCTLFNSIMIEGSLYSYTHTCIVLCSLIKKFRTKQIEWCNIITNEHFVNYYLY